MSCIFCSQAAEGDLLAANELAVGFWAGYPVSPGHALVVPRRHEADFFALSQEEQAAMLALVEPIRGQIDEKHQPDAYNLGANIGRAGGQTILHAHLHVIPRYTGDVEEPRGGVRWVLPSTARYW